MTYINDIEMLKVLPLFPVCHGESTLRWRSLRQKYQFGQGGGAAGRKNDLFNRKNATFRFVLVVRGVAWVMLTQK